MEEKTHYELVILGGGPAGLSAGLYAARARIDHVLIERGAFGGQVLLTDWIDNYPGFPDGISGFDLIEKMSEQAKRFDLNSLLAEVVSMDLDDPAKKSLTLDNGKVITFDTLIIGTGARANALGVPGEEENRGKGVSYCGTCDAPFYRNQEVVVVGGGNTAIQEAEYLTKFAKKVSVIHRRAELRATKVLQESALANDKIEFIWNSQVTSIEGANGVEEVHIVNNDGEKSVIKAQGIFIFVGITPLNSCLPLETLKADKWGFIPVDIETRTAVPGVMAAGDIISKDVRQVINAAGEGAVAVLAAEEYLNNQK